MVNKKAACEDGISAEFLKGLPEEQLEEIRITINKMWEEGRIPKGWDKARIVPIYKGGDEEQASNYRGISLLDAGYKLLTTMMAERLKDLMEKEEILRESQAGFRRARGTRDHIFVLNALINNKIKNVGGKLYVAFVDFKAAFDKVDRDIMLEKLWKTGIKGEMHRMVRAIYAKTVAEVQSGSKITKEFNTDQGVRQGCSISSTLFNI